MRRRWFVYSLALVLAAPRVSAQPATRMRRVAVLLGTNNDPVGQALLAAFRAGLKQRGWIEGKNLQVEPRWGQGDVGLMRKYADELVSLRPDIIFVHSATALRETRRATGDIPIVFASVSDPVGNKFVSNLARPGGNVTGFSLFEYEMGGKWLQLVKEAAPKINRVLLLMNANNPNWPGWLGAIEPLAPSLGVQVVQSQVRAAEQIEPTISAFAREPGGGLLVLPDPFMGPNRELILGLAAKHRLPAIYALTIYSETGGLMSYSVDQADLCGRAAEYVSRILKGEKPGELPVQLPTKFEFTVNLRTAKALGLTLPPAILIRADRVIE